eukprot:g1167.t1
MLTLLEAVVAATTSAIAFPALYAVEGPPPLDLGIQFNASFGDTMVLQSADRAGAKACLSGTLGAGGTAATLSVSSSAGRFDAYDVPATLRAGDDGFTLWSACLPPTKSGGGEATITALCTGCNAGNSSATLTRVVFGEVWYCSGQSNMALPLMHTLTRNASRDAVLKAGKYGNIRIHGMSGNMNPTQPWATLEAALGTADDSDKSAFGSFSSTCYYFGEQLSDELAALSADGKTAPPIGLIHTAWGGSMIEQWLTNQTIAQCANASLGSSNQQWHDQRVLPYVGTTVAGWVWYQGENDMHGFFGNSALRTGYSCLMPKLVAEWRRLWSAEPGTTAPDAPFGLVTLAPSGGEGGASIGTMRWAQTAGFGAVPNAAMPNTFLAQAFDLNDPFANISCYGKTKCHDNMPWNASWPPSCRKYCDSVRTSNFYMGPIHPRDKRPVGQRLGGAAAVAAYGKQGHASGPTLAGCTAAGGKVTLRFKSGGGGGSGGGAAADGVRVQPYYDGTAVVGGKAYDALGSKMAVLLNASMFCMQEGGRGAPACRDDGTGRAFDAAGYDASRLWRTVDVAPGAAANEVVLDLARTNGTAFAVRYAWTGDCCSENPPTSEPCPVASCPLMGTGSGLPVNPFVAKIEGGKCKCVAPTACDE